MLAHDLRNGFACLGAANVLAFFNKTEDAQEIYKLLIQSNPNMHQALLNHAHLSVGEKKFELAINLYENVLEKLLPNDLRTGMYLAKAYYWKGDYERSKKLTLQQLARHPHNLSLRFNLALCLHAWAAKTIRLPNRRA